MIILYFDLGILQSVHLQKSLCQIVLRSSKILSRESAVVGNIAQAKCFENEFSHVYSSQFFVIRFYFLIKLLMNRNSDLLLLHLTLRTLLLTILTKWLFPRCRVVLKMDADPLLFEYQPRAISRCLMKISSTKINHVIVESEKMANMLVEWGYFPVNKDSIEIISNAAAEAKIGSVSTKKQQIIAVSRFGSEQKNTPLLIELLKHSNELSRFNIKLIGSVEDSYREKFDAFLDQYPTIVWEGEITDVHVLAKYFACSKALLHTARYEGFATVFPEAIANGCHIISTPVNGFYECSKQGRFGFELSDEITPELVQHLDIYLSELFSQGDFSKPREFGLNNFTWSKVLTKGMIDKLWQN